MTLSQKIQFLREERFHDLNAWQQGFIDDLYDFVQDAEEELTPRQIGKVEEIWEEMGL